MATRLKACKMNLYTTNSNQNDITNNKIMIIVVMVIKMMRNDDDDYGLHPVRSQLQKQPLV